MSRWGAERMDSIHIGHTLHNRYRLESVIGQGGMGITYKAHDLNTQSPVAVKLLHFSHVQDWKALELFEREAKILQHLQHPQIPDYIEYFTEETESDTRFVLVQQYIAGKTLEQLVEEGWRKAEPEILNIFLRLVDVLQYLHALQPPVIHRDINPKNIILSSEGVPYLVDFGAVQDRIRTTVQGNSTVVGTFGYMPFEQIHGQAVAASDYYALGATLLYVLSHQHPGDFEIDGLKPLFQENIQAAPHTMALLDRLLEPDVNRRLTSPEQVKALLLNEESASAEHEQQRLTVSEPDQALPSHGTLEQQPSNFLTQNHSDYLPLLSLLPGLFLGIFVTVITESVSLGIATPIVLPLAIFIMRWWSRRRF